ncbi:MAG: radical SAM family heme chaperone HemW [Herpetosiphonaceae bacterium]|nr:radical SAM family heme chaperone HemW [Herpetosiphonaceae bacterium]
MQYPRHLYIHIPFCQRRCSYCDFNTYANMEDRIDAYVAALCTELKGVAQTLPPITSQSSVHANGAAAQSSALTRADLRPTIFLGGGTPTMLSLQQMERVLAAANEIVPLQDAEVTTEANPGTVIDEGYLQGLRTLGINRISFGVQSLHDPTLRVLGRIHTAGEALATFEQARRAGFDRINLDFIFGLPGQTLEQWRWTLDRAMEIGADHFSLYSLIVEEGTPLHQQVTRGSITVPDDDVSADMYELAMERLAAGGYTQYEISNWARNDAAQVDGLTLPSQACQHNVAYWLNADYLACGAGAHGHVYPRRWHDILGVDAYIKAMVERGSAVAEIIEVTPADLWGETMMMGLRLNAGVSYAHFADRCGHELRDVYGVVIDGCVREGLMVADEVGVRLTARGRMVGNRVFARFLEDVPA